MFTQADVVPLIAIVVGIVAIIKFELWKDVLPYFGYEWVDE